MYQSILSGAYHGMESYLVQVEVDVSDGLPCIDMIGYLAGEVKESRERVRVGIKNSGYKIPPKRITVSLSPADIRKDGSGFDLPVAIGIVLALYKSSKEEKVMKLNRDISFGLFSEIIVLGELGLNGGVKPAKGVLPILLRAAEEGVKYCIVPKENEEEARIVKGMQCVSVSTLTEALEWMEQLSAGKIPQAEEVIDNDAQKYNPEYETDFSQVAGQHHAKRAAEIAVSGLHNIIFYGPPGSGKSMIAERMRTILPPMTHEQCMDVTKIKSVIGEMGDNKTLVIERPYESAHHLITPYGLIGGGGIPTPGIVTRAHNGILFLDELPEFGRAKLDLLREPLEEKKIRIIRKKYAYTYPANFMLVAAMNPCPCGYYPDRNRCNCRRNEIAAYLKRISGPLLDRIDISAEVGNVEWKHLKNTEKQESSEEIRKRVKKAYDFQIDRQNKLNSDLTKDEIDQVCNMSSEAERMLQYTFKEKQKSVRSYDRIRKVSRTIADMSGADRIEAEHMAEAIVLNAGMERLVREGTEVYEE